jgi:hypothetical protein
MAVEVPAKAAPEPSFSSVGSRPSSLPTNSPFYGLGLRDAAFKLLFVSHPKHTQTSREIWEALASAGFTSAHSEPSSAVDHALSKRAKKYGDVLRAGGGKWGLKAWYTENELDDISKSMGPMGGRDKAQHGERTKKGMLVARSRGVRLGKELFFTQQREAEFKRRYQAGESVSDIVASWGKSDEQLAGQGDDHLLARGAGILGASFKPLCQGALLLKL